MRTLAIVPAYNEEDVIIPTLEGLVAACPEVEVLVIDDGSADATARLCREAGFHVVSHPTNCGLATGFRTGIRFARDHGFDAVVQFDADGQHLPEYIHDMEAAMDRTGADIVIASRIVEGGGGEIEGLRAVGSKLISSLVKLTTGTRITDPTSGFRLYSSRLFDEFADGFDLGPEPDALAWLMRHGATVAEVPCSMRERQGGTSYLAGFSSLAYMARTCLNILVFQWFRH